MDSHLLPWYSFIINGYTGHVTGSQLCLVPHLGVTIDNELKFHRHISNAVNKASRLLGLVKATFTWLDEITVPRLFTAMVRPHLEYGNVIWSPRYLTDSKEIEIIQRRATKLVPSLKVLPYEEERLLKLKLPSLLHRRRRGDMIQVYKIKSAMDRIEHSLFFHQPEHTGTRGHSQKIQSKNCRGLKLTHRTRSQ